MASFEKNNCDRDHSYAPSIFVTMVKVKKINKRMVAYRKENYGTAT